RLALDQHARRDRVRGGLRPRRAAEKLGRASGRYGRERDYGTRQRPLRGRARPRNRRRGRRGGRGIDRRERDRQDLVGHGALELTLGVMGELAGAGLGEIDAIAGAQTANLALEVRSLRSELTGRVDKTVPHVNEGDAGLLGALAIELV